MKNLFNFLKTHYILMGIVLILVVIAIGMSLGGGSSADQTMTIVKGDFLQQVSVSGKVVAADNLDLSFEQSGRITSVPVHVGDKVYPGQTLVSQNSAELSAQLQEMQAGIEVQKARLAQLLSGASPEDIALSETAVASAKQKLADALQDAYTKADDAVRGKADQMFSNARSASPHINNVFTSKSDIENARFSIEGVLTAWSASLGSISASSDLDASVTSTNSNLNKVKTFLDLLAAGVNNLSTNGDVNQATIDKWRTDISTARTSVSATISNITTTREALVSAEADLTLKKAPVRQADIDLYQAQIRQAEASMQNVIAQINKRSLRAPITSVVTVVNAKVGSNASAGEVLVSLIGANSLQIESFVPEKNIPFIKLGDKATLTLDAYGAEVPFDATVVSIDPAETIRDGVSTYRVKFAVDKSDERIKSGMTANVLVTTDKRPGVIAVPVGAVAMRDGKKFVQIKNGEQVEEREVTTGAVSSLGQVEILTGLAEGDVVVLKAAN